MRPLGEAESIVLAPAQSPMKTSGLSRRELLRTGLKFVATVALGSALRPFARAAESNRAPRRIFDVRDYGAKGDGTTLDTAAIQRAIDEAAAAGSAQVLVRGGKRYLIGALVLKGGIDFHLADDAELLVSTDPQHFTDQTAISATGAHGLRLTGTGS